MSATRALGFGVLFTCATVASAQALAPDRIFERNAPGVWVVRALDAQDKPLASGSGVVASPGTMITSCRLLARAQKIEVRQGNYVFKANLEHPDVERDLCQLHVAGLAAAALGRGATRTLRIGQRVFVVGHLRGSDQSLNDGLVSSLRDADSGAPRILTSVAAATGLLGGGVFDEQGRLVGVAIGSPKDAPNALFAAPVEWIDELPARAKAALAARRSAPAGGSAAGTPASPELPTAGATYRYQWSDRQYGRQQEFKVQVNGVDGWTVHESFAAAGAPGVASAVNVRDQVFTGRRLAEGKSLLEFAPYLTVQNPVEPLPLEGNTNYPTGGLEAWSISTLPMDWGPVVVPAGNYRALRLEIRGSRRTSAANYARGDIIERFELTAWYAPDARRYVKLQHKSWSGLNRQLSDELVELLEYRAN
jgi:S1-C subfamily serine protease